MPEPAGRVPVFLEPHVLVCCVCVKMEVGLKELLCCRSRKLEENTHSGLLSGVYSVAVRRAAPREILVNVDLGPCNGGLTPQWIMDQRGWDSALFLFPFFHYMHIPSIWDGATQIQVFLPQFAHPEPPSQTYAEVGLNLLGDSNTVKPTVKINHPLFI